MTRSKLASGARLAALVLASVALYARSVAYGFTLDDAYTVTGHPGVTGPLTFEDLLLRDFWGRSFANTIGSWRPTATLALWASWHLGHGKPWVFHAANLLLAAAVLVLAERFLARFFGAALSRGARLAAVLSFGVLAIHADVVPSATGCAELLAALFALLALLLALGPERHAGPPAPLRVRDALASALAVALAIGAKESALPIALLVPVLAFRWQAQRRTATGPGLVVLTAAHALVLAFIVAFRVLRMPFMAPGPERATENPLIAAGPGARVLGAADVLARYVGHTVWPSRLAPDYSYAATDAGHAPLLVALGILGVLGVAFAALRARRTLGVPDAALGFAASYVVVSHAIVPAIAVVADRLFFFPSFWLVTLAALALERARVRLPGGGDGRTRRVMATAVSVFVVGQAAVAVRDGGHWREDATLLTAAVRARPTAARARRNLAQLLADAGKNDEAAWELAVSMAILTHAPEPLAEDAYPRAWEDEPVSKRLEALRTREGDAPLRVDLAFAAATFRRWGSVEAALVLDDWAAHLQP